VPLKLVCGRCGELLYYVSAIDACKNVNNLCVPEIIFGPKKLKGTCPGCDRRFTVDDIKNMQVHITGRRADSEFYGKGGRKRRTGGDNYRDRWTLVVGNEFPVGFEPMWLWHGTLNMSIFGLLQL